MPFETSTPNMNLVVPGVGLTPGPQYASDLNASLTIIDAHNHAPGSGVQITPSGLDLNTNVSFLGNSLLNVKSVDFTSNLSPIADLESVYVSGVDLWYNDGVGNQIKITSAGSVNAGSGSITGLVSPASATYISGSQTFVWQSNVSTAANMDMGSAILRNITSGSQGITLSPPSSLGASYTITLPQAVPLANNTFLTMSTAGVISDVITVDNSTINISSGHLQVAPLGITAAQIANATITATQIQSGTITGTQVASNINLPGNAVKENGQNLIVQNTNTTNSLAIVRGASTKTGGAGVALGEGWTITLIGANAIYQVTFTTPFSGTPVVVVNPYSDTFNPVTTVVGSITASGFQVDTFNNSTTGFCFIAIGPR